MSNVYIFDTLKDSTITRLAAKKAAREACYGGGFRLQAGTVLIHRI